MTVGLRYSLLFAFHCSAMGSWTPTKYTFFLLLSFLVTAPKIAAHTTRETRKYQNKYVIEPFGCRLVVDEPCPQSDVRFYLYTRRYADSPQFVSIENATRTSDIIQSDFDSELPTKIIVHGYNSDRHLSALVEIKKQYLEYNAYNVFMVDWAQLAQGPCYLTAIYNIRQVGKCTAQLVQRIRDLGATDIHMVGFSLGAHVTNYVARYLEAASSEKLPRISGLDPAMPGFTFVPKEHKLDASDALFVDVIHTNAFIQGQIEQSGHVDFYVNGGIVQPGCWAERRFFACNHHRAAIYFAESISSRAGFWGWPCGNYFMYLLGQCPPTTGPQILLGEHMSPPRNVSLRGMYLVITSSVAPFAVGEYFGPTIQVLKNKTFQNIHFLYNGTTASFVH